MTTPTASAALSVSRAVLDASITEKQFSQQVMDALGYAGWLAYRTWKSIHSPAGFPDIVALRQGRILVLELKTERGKVSTEQQEWIDAFQATVQVEMHVLRPSGWAEFEQWIA